jgi:outer membrane protein, heavy metal efflux system
MRLRRTAFLFLWALPVLGQGRTLTLDETLELARRRGSAAVSLARGRVEEALALRERALRRFQENPGLEVTGGYRNADDGFFDFEALITQGLDSGPRRSARLAGAEAALAQAEAELAEAERLLVREARSAFFRAANARERSAIFARDRQLADQLLAATGRRYEAGEAVALDLNRARTAAAQARAGQSAAEAEGAAALATLRALAGLEPGEVDLRPDPPSQPDLPKLLERLDLRPDLAALAAGLREAEAEVQRARALSRPEVGVRGGLAREEGAEIALAGVVLSLPVHDRGREALAAAEARAAALRQALGLRRQEAATELRGRYEAFILRQAAARELEQTVGPILEDSESLALKSFEAGEIGLGELLLIRRETLEARLSLQDRLSEVAAAYAELEEIAGGLP